MRILVYIEQADGALAGASGELITLARRLAEQGNGSVEALVAAAYPAPVAAQVTGGDVILTAAHAALSPYTQAAHAAVLEAAIAERKPDLVLFGYTSLGLDLAPYLAARTGFAYAGYCTGLSLSGTELSANCQIYGGKLEAQLSLPLPAIVAVTPGSCREESFARGTPEELALSLPATLGETAMRVVSVSEVDPNAIDITQADKLICVGRGIGEKDNIEEARELAAAIGGELVSSRPLVDIGWMPKERQVGKSGRKVKPRLYLALGVSGAPEHLEGMGASDLIIAINTDAKAPIFQVAHYGATVDCLDLIPALKDALGGGT